MTEDERQASEWLGEIGLQNDALLELVLGYQWVNDGLTSRERWAILDLRNLGVEDLGLSQRLTRVPWLADDLNEHESWAVRYLLDIAREDAATVHSILDLPWLQDDLTENERWAVHNVRDIAWADLGIAQTVLGLPWLTDGVSQTELWTVTDLRHIAQQDTGVARRILVLPWLADDITPEERSVFIGLRNVAQVDPSAAESALELPWMTDQITPDEVEIVSFLGGLAREGASLPGLILKFAWFADGITPDEQWMVDSLSLMAPKDPSLAGIVLSSPFLNDPFTSRGVWAVGSLRFLQDKYPDVLAMMMQQGWFSDGVDNDEAALVIAIGAEDPYLDPEDFQHLITQHVLRSRKVELPLSGEVIATEIRPADLWTPHDITSWLERAASAIESFMDVPLPVDDLIVLRVGCEGSPRGEDCDFWGLNRSTHVAVHPGLDTLNARVVLVSALANHYWNAESGVPLWFHGSATAFLQSYVKDVNYGGTLDARKRLIGHGAVSHCQARGVGSIEDWMNALAEEGYEELQERGAAGCIWYYGEGLLLDVYDLIGKDAFRSALNEIYLTGQSLDRDMTEEEIYQTFRSYTPERKLRFLVFHYGYWHGGEFSD